VTVKEEGCLYELDFRAVYWNSRLGGEHRRLVDLIQNEALASNCDVVVADLMAGIGPFAVPLTSKGVSNIHVYANDLNPSSFKYLEINSKKNKCRNLRCYNMDGRAFCHKLQDENIVFHHVLMNLPATAPEFLDAFRGFTGVTLPRIHVHCFSTKETVEAERAIIERCGKALGVPLEKGASNIVVHLVRNVAPNKNMYCVSFDLPESVRAVSRIPISRRPVGNEDEPDTKRTKV
jgi:tRNA (guanine37-N1)-methyltransferase